MIICLGKLNWFVLCVCRRCKSLCTKNFSNPKPSAKPSKTKKTPNLTPTFPLHSNPSARSSNSAIILRSSIKIASKPPAILRPWLPPPANANHDKTKSGRAPRSENIAAKAHLEGLIDYFPDDFERRKGSPGSSGKALLVVKLLRKVVEMGDDKVVLVSCYTQTLDLLAETFQQERIGVIRLDGSVPTSKRQKLVDMFNDPLHASRVMLLSSKAGGCGLNLIGANRLIMYDPSWNPADDAQAMARVWRSGQK
eukprot:GABV01001710.1.p1 GENE.GABV01001710.1~~GABV01001710.1.p1  ORF type:complete len:252 (-),score=74.40 GABV01001710.1:18-773(-)